MTHDHAPRPVIELADRFFAAIAAGDIDTVRDLYAPDAVIWHNFDGIEQTADENVRVLAWVSRHLPDVRYTDVDRVETPTGFAQRHVLRATSKGEAIEIPAALFVTVTDGRISRLDEYIDSRHVDRLAAS